jgi:hypothetical protein
LAKIQKKTIKAPLLHFFCYFSIGDIVCDPAVYGLWSDSARWVLFHRKRELDYNYLSLCCDRSALNLAGGVISLLIIIYNHLNKKNTIQVKLLE